MLGTILFTTLGQFILKMGQQYLKFPEGMSLKELFNVVVSNFFNFYVVCSIIMTFFAAFCWMLAVQKIALSRAYPLLSLNYVLVYFLSIYFFGESFSTNSIVGLIFIILGVIFIGFK